MLLFIVTACKGGGVENETPEKPDVPGGEVVVPEDPASHYAEMKIPASEEDSKARAFPGAEGCGMFATGGRGGSVYHVTNTGDSGEGSLRYGIENAPRPCIIVFDVGGTISLTKDLKITKGNITIAGQTAPGGGICLKDRTLNIQAGNVVIRFLRCRMGDVTQSENDAMNSYFNNPGASGWSGIIIDHCSLSWSIDECGSFYGSADCTLQWCILSESLMNSVHSKDAHGYGGIWGGQSVSFHHNLIANHSNRTPRLCGSRYSNDAAKEKVEVVNNVIFNWTGEGAYGGQGGSYNLISNYYKPGPASVASKTHCRFFTPYPDDGKNNQAEGSCGKFFLSGNFMDGSAEGLSSSQNTEIVNANADNFASSAFSPKTNVTGKSGKTVVCKQSDFKAAARFDISHDGSSITEQSAAQAFESVLNGAGACLVRDAVDQRIVGEVRSGKCTFTGSKSGLKGIIDSQSDVGGWPEYASGEAVADTDRDGMPDWFEKQVGLDPASAADGSTKTIDTKGRYTNIEMYLHYIVRDIIAARYK